jgi:protein tyrosine phosphatase
MFLERNYAFYHINPIFFYQKKIKCARYWPDPVTPLSPNSNQILKIDENDSIKCNDLIVKFVRLTRICEDYILREFTINKERPVTKTGSTVSFELKQPRVVYQFQYLAWSDHGVPENIQNTLNFVDHFNKLYKDLDNRKPITVHCRYFSVE